MERGQAEKGLEWKRNIVEKWGNFTPSEQERYLPDLKEAVRWSNTSNAGFMLSVNPKDNSVWKVECDPETDCAEQIRRLKDDERLRGIPEESLAFEAWQRGMLGSIYQGGRIDFSKKKKRSEEADEISDIEIQDAKGSVFESEREEKRPQRKERKPQRHFNIFARL